MAGIEAVLPALGGVGVVGALVLVVAYLLAGNRADRKDYWQAIGDGRRELAAEEARHAETQRQLDVERATRRVAEDTAAVTAREMAALRAQVVQLNALIVAQTQRIAQLEAEVARLTSGRAG